MTTNRVFIIAEAGVNHNGSLDMALQLIDAAADAGVDAVKFQTFKAGRLVSKWLEKAEYQKKSTNPDESQFEMLKKLELNNDAHRELISRCKKKGIQFLSTPFEAESLDFLAKELDLPQIKIPSGEITNLPLLLQAAQTGKKVLLSTGMSTIGEIETALGTLAFGYTGSNERPALTTFQQAYFSSQGRKLLRRNVTLMHCTTEYPAPFNDVNLRAMESLIKVFGLPVGYSDHTEGAAVPIAAVALGAKVIEKHFTLDKKLPGPDHRASLEPCELKFMVQSIREVEKALGIPQKIPTAAELRNRVVARKSIVAKREIQQGELLDESNIDVKRPGDGISPWFYWEIIGKVATRDYEQDEVIRF